ncbi:MAG: N-acetyllactosaminide 3-alpha-galactosyltransferase [Parcubacteria group bacterium]|nr:N-acetyllactosaminide 3-alpha-galactosyltransferase [Parcubacteria group bacterium]
MRLCIATPLYPPEPGGPATYAKTLEEGLPALGWEVSLVTFSEVRHLPSGIRHIAYMLRVLKAGKDADVILALDPVSVGWPAAIAAGLMRKPFVVKIVGDFAWEQGTQRAGITVPLDVFARTRRVPFFVSILRSVQEYVAQHARTIIVPSIYLKSIVTAWGIDPTKIEVVYNALSIDEVIPEKILPPHTIVSVARLVPWKGMRELIDAVAQVRKEVPDATLIIIGDGPERAALEAHARDTASDSVQFLGALSHPETLANMRAASVFALNSTYEGLSHVLIEALLFGTPIVASDAGGNPELITNEQNGLLVPTGDTQALTQALVRALQGPKFSASPVVERFALPTMLKETSAILSRI